MRGKAASTNKSILGKSEFKNGKLDQPGPLAQPPKCPECASQKVWKDGVRPTRNGDVQRYLCRTCGYRFSEHKVEVNVTGEFGETSHSGKNVSNSRIGSFDLSRKEKLNGFSLPSSENVSSHGSSSTVTSVAKPLKALPCYNSKRRVCETDGVLKNLVEVETRLEKRAAGATTHDIATVKGKILEFAFWLDKQGYPEGTRKRRVNNIKRLYSLGADLWNPESIKEILAKQKEWGNHYKNLLRYAYENFLKMEGLTWEPPKYRKTETLPFIPMETELDQLIASCGKKVGTFLQGLKDTGSDPGELAKLRWIDINKESRTVNIRPVKGHNPRIVPVSNDFINRLERLPKTRERVFSSQESLNSTYYRQRKRIAYKVANPRLRKISFTTFRHWKGTMEYHLTKDILHVKRLLGHKNIQNTMIYINLEAGLFNTTNDQFHVKTANTVEEACKLAEIGFEYFTTIESVQIFRKRK